VSHGTPRPTDSRRYLEGITTGVGYACALVALGAFVMASFRPDGLPTPYWDRLAWLRTDTLGALCFAIAIVAFALSEYLRISRRTRFPMDGQQTHRGARSMLIIAAARTLVVAGTVLVIYLSVNAVTHPRTMTLPATHLLSWPSEETLRVATLVIVAVAVSMARSLGISLNLRQGA
jgi:hypothetical protein